MIYLNLTVRNPWSELFKHVRAWSGRITANTAWEVEVYRSDTIVEAEFKFNLREDHAGLALGLGLLSCTVRAQIYDTRHWDYTNNCWHSYETHNVNS